MAVVLLGVGRASSASGAPAVVGPVGASKGPGVVPCSAGRGLVGRGGLVGASEFLIIPRNPF